MLRSKRITIGITGGIAAYKTVELVRLLVKQNTDVNLIMTDAAKRFVQPLLFSSICSGRVYTDMFDSQICQDMYNGRKSDKGITHIELAQRSDLLVIAPATANIIAKSACGIADDLLSTVILAAGCDVVFCPAMNTAMYENPITQRNISKLKELGYHFIGPKSGDLACDTSGLGRMAEPTEIFRYIESCFRECDLKNEKILITAGPTIEDIDAVRYISNRSSGKMGYSLAEACVERGASVTLISGPVNLYPPSGVKLIKVRTAEQMYKAVMDNFKDSDIVIKAAAVADFKPKGVINKKIKKKEILTLELEKTTDILLELGKMKAGKFLVGFAAETEEIDRHAVEKLEAKNLNMIVANDVSMHGAGFDVDTNIVKIFPKNGVVVKLSMMSKKDTAHRIIDEIIRCKNGSTN